jgi:uncharacterized protein involved in outer membrane biogenesis
MKPSFQWSTLNRKTRALLILLGTVVVFLLLFDWNWFRHPLERYLSSKSHRAVQIKDLHVKIGLEPTVRLRGLYIENAAWAQKRPMADAGEVSFTFSLRSVWEKRPVISLLVLSDADVNMERLSDGRRNWRLTHPEDTSPGKVKVLTLEAHRAKVGFIEHSMDLDILVAARMTRPGESGPDSQALTTQLDFSGTYKNAKFSGTTLTGDLLTFQESGKFFPLRGHLVWGDTRVDLDGNVADIFKLSTIDAKVRFTGSSLANLYPFLPLPLPASHSYQIAGQLKKNESKYAFGQLRGKIGATDIVGDASYSGEEPRSALWADLHSESAHFSDLGPLVGIKSESDEATTETSSEGKVAVKEQQPNRPGPKPARTDRVLPNGHLEADRLKAIDAHVTFEAKKLKSPDILALESLRFKVDLKDGLLDLNPIDFGLAGGHVVGVITLDAREEPLAARATVDFRSVRLDKLFPTVSAMARSAGAIGAQIKLTGRGTSIATILGNSSGSLAIAIDGGHISNLLDAETTLNGGKILRLLMGGDKDIAIHCAALAVDFHNGMGQSRTVVFDTEQTRTDGSGTINLRDEKLDFLLRPKPKRPAILSLRAPVRFHGSFKHADFAVDKGVVLARA